MVNSGQKEMYIARGYGALEGSGLLRLPGLTGPVRTSKNPTTDSRDLQSRTELCWLFAFSSCPTSQEVD